MAQTNRERELTALDATGLDRRLRGSAVAPDGPGWDDARVAWNLRVDQHPALVAFVEDGDDIAAVLSFARSQGLRVAVQGTGHGARAGVGDGALLLRTERLRRIDVDADARVARVEAGVLARDLGAATSPYGLSAFPGAAADVGVTGYTLGGGLGWLARRHGLACNHVRAIERVTADGQQRRTDKDTEPDLFWALRGGGGSFGVVRAIEFDLVELSEVYAGTVIYPADKTSGDILRGYLEWAAAVPDEVTSLTRFLRLPNVPGVPEPLRDRPLIMMAACHAGPADQGAELLSPLRNLATSVADTFGPIAPSELVRAAMDPEQPTPSISDTTSLGPLSAEAIDALVTTAGPDANSPLVSVELRQLGGALSTPAEGAGARPNLDATWILTATGVPRDPAMTTPMNDQIDTIRAALAPWAHGSRLPNFVGRPTKPELLFDAATLARLRQVRLRYDPGGLLAPNIPIT